MMKKITMLIVFLLLFSTSAAAQTKQIEVFDITKGKIIMRKDVNPNIQKDVENYVKGIQKVYAKLQPIPKSGLMVKVPLEPTIRVENQWLSAIIEEAIIIIPPDDPPVLMLFDDENRSLFFTFRGNVNSILKNLNIEA